MIIYRYERNGNGPFRFAPVTDDEYELDYFLCSSLRREDHPVPNKNLYEGDFDEYYFGCSSIEELHHWFNDNVRFMFERCGFELKVYDCPDKYCVVEKNQIGFIKSKATLVENFELVS